MSQMSVKAYGGIRSNNLVVVGTKSLDSGASARGRAGQGDCWRTASHFSAKPRCGLICSEKRVEANNV